ncbi:hypothetical protein CSIV_14210 [Microbacterium sp. CSI-V]|uniref:hypothetical protein n=1 Tax=Microbacterium sp. CSI-V TaxID=1933777 RepID=UPI00097C0BB5|nr:hypothetical protein [Microbacterium sp. CSI-V]ONI62625.1 hypothetical protein CSIV_14210 [Microbacterium sp. CSI-V]
MATKNAAPRFKNVSPLGALDVPALGRVIAAGEEFEIREDLVPLFAAQVGNFEPVNAEAQAAQAGALSSADDETDGEPGGGETEEVKGK